MIEDINTVHESFFKGKVTEVEDTQVINEFGFETGVRAIHLELKDGSKVQVEQPVNLLNESDNLPVKEGDELVLVQTTFQDEVSLRIQEPYRLDGILWFLGSFIFLAVFVTGKKGLYSLIGLGLSLLIIVKWLIPQILAGHSPLLISFVGTMAIALLTFYLSHGLKQKTTLAFLGTLFTLMLAFLVSVLAVKGIQLFGTGTEEAISLNFGGNAINLKGLLLGAMVIGTLGILDDVTITQVATVQEIHQANSKLSAKELYKRGMAVGKDHIASIINTLVLAYAGASFPVLILLVTSSKPFWVSLNSEFLAEEVVRTLVGSMTLILAIPIATLFAAGYYARPKKISE